MSELTRFYDADIRVDELIWLPGTLACDVFPKAFYDFCDDLPNDRSAPLFAALPELASLVERGTTSSDDLAEKLSLRTGFLVKGAHPARTYNSGRSWFSGWGVYVTCWFYVDQQEQIAPTLIEWAEQRNAVWLAVWQAAQ